MRPCAWIPLPSTRTLIIGDASMKKRQMTIEEYHNASGIRTIIINNARFQECFPNAVEKIMKAFLVDKDVFFGFCRTDGLNLTFKQVKELKDEIPVFFKNNGDFQKLSEYLTVARIESDSDWYSFIPSVFDYYLETIMFNPEVEWESFRQFFSNFHEKRIDDIINNNLAELLFFYFDSGDFSICFNPQKYNPREVRSMIEMYFSV